MAEPALKLAPEQKARPPQQDVAIEAIASRPRRSFWQRHRRVLLLVVLPLVAVAGGLTFYLNGGRYVTTDDAYVGAQKVLVTPDISGKIDKVVVREGQQVKKGDLLFEIDPVPFRLAVRQATAKLNEAKVSYDDLRTNLKLYARSSELSQQSIALKQRDVERKSALVKSNAGSQLDLEKSMAGMVQAQGLNQILQQRIASTRSQLLGNPDLPLAEFPAYMQAKAALEEAERNLRHTELRAPIDGVATQVDNIQLGRFVAAGTPVFSIIDTSARLTAFVGTAMQNRVAYAMGFTGQGVSATRFAALTMLDLLQGKITERTQLKLLSSPAVPFPPEPIRSLAIRWAQADLAREDRDGRRSLLLRTLNKLGIGFGS